MSSQVRVDFICSSPGRLMMRGVDIGWTHVIGVPGCTKYPVVPSYAIAISSAIFTLPVLNIVSALREGAMFNLS